MGIPWYVIHRGLLNTGKYSLFVDWLLIRKKYWFGNGVSNFNWSDD